MKQIFTKSLSHKGKQISWKESIGFKVHFIYDDIEGDIEIVNYIAEKQKLIIKYNNNIFEINTNSFINCRLGKILGKYTSDFKYEIGTILKDNKRDITIIDREYRKDRNGHTWKYYKYTCNVCRWDEGWSEESNLNKGTGCSCCANRTPVLGINTIWDTDPWMIPIVGEEFAKTHTHSCNDSIYPFCIHCGERRNVLVKVNNIYNRKRIGCICEDNIPYPEKAMYYFLSQLGLDFQTQLNKTTFEWCEKYKYDFYFVLSGEQYIIETHGEQHYEENTNFKMNLKEVQKNDQIKKELAINNGIKPKNYIVIDCRKSELEFIKQNILNSILNELFDLSIVNWLKVESSCLKNIIKEICKIKKDFPNLTCSEIAIKTGRNRNVIREWLKKGTKFGWCNYSTYDSKEIGRIKINKNLRDKLSKPIIHLNKGIVFWSITDCSNASEYFFGENLTQGGISRVCRGERKHYKGHNFKFIKDLTPEEYIKYDIENKLKELNKDLEVTNF